jgi:hypothetical protein
MGEISTYDEIFTHGERIPCPYCAEHRHDKYTQVLQCIYQNYSGCSVDIGFCPQCGNSYQISYKIHSIIQRKKEADNVDTTTC